VINHLFISNIHHDILPAFSGTTKVKKFGAIGIIETFSVAGCVMAADIAAKTASIQLIEIRLANGLGGKGYFVLTGELADVEASVGAAKAHAQHEGLLAASEVIPAPHKELIEKGIYW
jgi:microcompartment protein CcmL/EutN